MPAGLVRYYGTNDLHFITCSCYQRRPFLSTPASRDLFLIILEEARLRHSFQVCGYVIMPEHVHLLIGEPAAISPSTLLQVVKQRFAKRLRECLPFHGAQVWQRRFYDFNVRTERKIGEKLDYMHQNPVKRGLVTRPQDWKWSSFCFHEFQEQGVVKILKERVGQYAFKN